MMDAYLIASILPALLGLWLCGDFLFWVATGTVEEGEVTGFQERKNKGRVLPVIRIERVEEEPFEVKPERIDQISYLLSPAIEKERRSVIVRKGPPARARLFGYLNLIAGLFLLAPCVGLLALHSGQYLFVGQLAYIVIFASILLGSWVLLKMIQKM
ncbi:MAG: hypothetical protein KDJ75_08495 [Alphaproteobacteria bacterium]|nr:hypothetical protein [Alphaproteobacteria bacterium]